MTTLERLKPAFRKGLVTAKRIAARAFMTLGIIAFIMLVLSFTDLPYCAYHALAMPEKTLKKDPSVIVMLGGNGMPSPDGLIRTYYTSEAAKKFKNAVIVIALPGDLTEKDNQPMLMARELMQRGIDSTRIIFETKGHNTRSQAERIAKMFVNDLSTSALIITSPEHMYRSIRTFEDVGFTDIAGSAAFEKPLDEDKIKQKDKQEDAQVDNLDFRYNMWSYLQYEIIVLREYTAIAYYKLKGWI